MPRMPSISSLKGEEVVEEILATEARSWRQKIINIVPGNFCCTFHLLSYGSRRGRYLEVLRNLMDEALYIEGLGPFLARLNVIIALSGSLPRAKIFQRPPEGRQQVDSTSRNLAVLEALQVVNAFRHILSMIFPFGLIRTSVESIKAEDYASRDCKCLFDPQDRPIFINSRQSFFHDGL